MTLDGLVAHYGLLGLFLGAGVEGEAVVVTGGVLAQRHLVPLWGAMLAAAAGSCLIDQLWFVLGRYGRRFAWVRALLHRPAAARAVEFVARHPRSFVFGFRFVYGLRTVSPIVIGASTIPTRLFVPLNMLAAAIWGPLFTLVGYAFGRAAQGVLAQAGTVGPYVLAAVAIACAVAAAVFVARKKGRPEGRPEVLGEDA